jgi:CheY-like chemotaxis protein
VLIVDDNADVRDILGRWFEYVGAAVVIAASPEEALALFGRVPPHIVLTDISMPRYDGYWLLRELRALEQTRRLRRTPVVAMTALTYRTPAVDAAHDDFDASLSKPIDLADLVTLVGRLLKKGHAA